MSGLPQKDQAFKANGSQSEIASLLELAPGWDGLITQDLSEMPLILPLSGYMYGQEEMDNPMSSMLRAIEYNIETKPWSEEFKTWIKTQSLTCEGKFTHCGRCRRLRLKSTPGKPDYQCHLDASSRYIVVYLIANLTNLRSFKQDTDNAVVDVKSSFPSAVTTPRKTMAHNIAELSLPSGRKTSDSTFLKR